MHRLTTSWLCVGVLAALSCGAPAELDESLFPGPNETGYADADGTGSTGTPLGGGGAAGQGAVSPPPNPNANAGSPAVSAGGSTAAPPVNNGNNASNGSAAPPASGMPVGAGGSAQAGAAGGGSAPLAGGASSGGCPEDITALFNRPITAGGCAGAACHIPGGTAPDLVSPNVEARLVNVLSQCGGRPYVGAGDSFLAEKIGGEQPECGYAMPFFMPDALGDADKQCILDWIGRVTGG